MSETYTHLGIEQRIDTIRTLIVDRENELFLNSLNIEANEAIVPRVQVARQREIQVAISKMKRTADDLHIALPVLRANLAALEAQLESDADALRQESEEKPEPSLIRMNRRVASADA